MSLTEKLKELQKAQGFSLPKELSVRKIQHYTIWVNNKPRYICNQAVGGTITKMVVDPTAITCKNCLRIVWKRCIMKK